jgi:oligoendopeptidase F
MGCYGVHPYMLLNYGGTFSDVSTLAHESGHSMHTWLSESTQPFAYADYTLFVAEVASTVNEMLLAEHMMKRVKDRDERIFLLNHQLEMIRTTIYRQTLFAEFERDAYLNMLRGGSSADPIALLKGAGVDMSTPEPVDRALKVFAGKLRELKGLMDL